MSIYSSQTGWPAGCSSATQSPINLSQSGAKPCSLSCDLVMDDGMSSNASVAVSDEGLILSPTSGSLGSCKFRGESYVCLALAINHPSHHTLEGVQGDGEIVAYFSKPTGERLAVSSLFRVSTSETPSYMFFKQFVPYAQTTGETQVALQDWGIYMMVPPNSAYYTYEGSSLSPPCMPIEWVVFKDMINMDSTDFAYLVRNVSAGSRSIQNLGNREVFFNDVENIPGGPMPHDNKYYLKLRPTGNSKKPKTPAPTIKLEKDPEKEDKHSWSSKAKQSLSNSVSDNGGLLGFLEMMFVIVAAVVGIYYGRKYAFDSPMKFEWSKSFGIWIRGFFVKKDIQASPT